MTVFSMMVKVQKIFIKLRKKTFKKTVGRKLNKPLKHIGAKILNNVVNDGKRGKKKPKFCPFAHITNKII